MDEQEAVEVPVEREHRDVVRLSMKELRSWPTRELMQLSSNRNVDREIRRREKRRARKV